MSLEALLGLSVTSSGMMGGAGFLRRIPRHALRDTGPRAWRSLVHHRRSPRPLRNLPPAPATPA